MSEDAEPYKSSLDQEGLGPLRDEILSLTEDARALARAELAYQKSRATYAGKQAGRIAMLGASAAVFLFYATMALVVGCVVALGPVLGAWGAMATVTGVLLLLCLICVVSALARARRMKRILSEDQDTA